MAYGFPSAKGPSLKPNNSLGDYAILLYKHPSQSPLILGDSS
jgi:hypothetical protein